MTRTLVVTDICNLRCKMCHLAFSDAPGYQLSRVGNMPPELFRKLMDEVPGHPIVTFTGGEALLHPNIAGFIAYAKSRGHFCTLTTNGWMLEKRAKEICESGLDALIVSVDGPREIHNRVRGNKSFERLSAGLDAVLSQPKRPLAFVSMAISDLNHDQLLPTYELARSWGVDGINFNHLWMQTSGMVETYNRARFSIFAADEVAWDIHPEKVDAAQVARALDEIYQRARFSSPLVLQTPDLSRRDIETWYREPERPAKYNSTRCAWIRMRVWPDGEIKPCREWSAGNLGQDHAMEIWNGEKFREFRQLLATRGTLPICARCCYIAHR
jgi:MoaA/NifB/PqqE/SkfB family radical SAM enzyme